MVKIPTMFVRDESKPGHPVTDVIKPECQWVLDGEGIATVKLDGTNLRIRGGILSKRQKPRNGDYDEASYVECARENPADRWAFEAFDALVDKQDGIYELIGPKVQGNPHKNAAHALVRVVPPHVLHVNEFNMGVERSFEGFRTLFALPEFKWEGLVFHHPDGRMAKIKKRDFGLKWPG